MKKVVRYKYSDDKIYFCCKTTIIGESSSARQQTSRSVTRMWNRRESMMLFPTMGSKVTMKHGSASFAKIQGFLLLCHSLFVQLKVFSVV